MRDWIRVLADTNNKKWEYKVIRVVGNVVEGSEDFYPLTFDDQTQMLNKMGKEGWELVNVYTEINTAMPNYGKSEYVLGLRSNTRTAVINFVFKRQYKETKKENPVAKANGIDPALMDSTANVDSL